MSFGGSGMNRPGTDISGSSSWFSTLMSSVRRRRAPLNLSPTELWTSTRSVDMQICPAFARAPNTTASTASSRFASLRTITGAMPPNSRTNRFRHVAAQPAMILPTRSLPDLQLFTSPNEMNALSAASRFAQITGRPAAVLVHVECGTQGLAGAIHDVSKGRTPALVLAGVVPQTMGGEFAGSRNEYIHWIQDVPDQRAIVRQYKRYEHEIRRPHNAAQIVLRALQFAVGNPQGPTYLVASREILCEEFEEAETQVDSLRDYSKNMAVELVRLSATALDELACILPEADRPLIVTSYCGCFARGFEAPKALAKVLSIPVHENARIYSNFSPSFLHQGHQWNGDGQLPALAEADVVLVIDADVPWIPAQSRPPPKARIFHLDHNPLKEGTTLWAIPCEQRWKCDSPLALEQLVASVGANAMFHQTEARSRIEERRNCLQERSVQRSNKLRSTDEFKGDGGVTVPYFMCSRQDIPRACLLGYLEVVTTNLGNVANNLRWYSGAAVGALLALQASGRSGDLVVAFTGDGTWLFGVSSCAYWLAKKYDTLFLTTIRNNEGWAAPKNAFLRLNPDATHNSQMEGRLCDRVMTSTTPSPGFGEITEGAGDA
ncbi:thiamine pyrophosphate enzyme, N-terminal TPP binding domain-containing protein [Hypoxylon cercidicola]|nr:thiamine pyrophosphate enzyme, N-terminal TPP binding domain-containing protein [Hypoxylon cercidicola]